MKQEILVTD